MTFNHEVLSHVSSIRGTLCCSTQHGMNFCCCSNYGDIHFWLIQSQYTVKKVRKFPVPSRDVTTQLSLGGNNDVITELFLPRGSLVSDIPAGDGKLVNLFYGVHLVGL